ncbi:MAG: phosphatase PAP2 family protein [Bacteroidetes bacterium]|nr:phosphatase PAP2 family protein [Bacteroidota bacterium]
MKKLVLLLLCLLSLRVSAVQLTDTALHAKRDTIKVKSFILPAALVAYGSLSFAVHPLRRFDYYLDGQLRPGIKTTAATYLIFTPIAAVYGLNLSGVQGRNNFVDRTALITLSACFGGVVDVSFKQLVRRPGPGGFESSSFPSGHTIGAFAAAEFLSQEYGDRSPAYTIAGYTVAIAVGGMRMYTHNHWFSDVVAGAGFGIASTRLAYLVYPSIKRWLTHTDKTGRSAFIMPTYQDGMAGLSFAKTF